MRIQHNIMAMNAYRNYSNNVSAMKANLEKLSSGYKINRAGDDAAGLAISEKMRAQITGLETAQKNAKDGISLVQTAEGALTEVHDMLNRMVELATQSANGTYDNDTDRYQLQKEMDQLNSEINRIADSANFNGIKLLDGSMDADGRVANTTTIFSGLTASDNVNGTTETTGANKGFGGTNTNGTLILTGSNLAAKDSGGTNASKSAELSDTSVRYHKDASEAGKTAFTVDLDGANFTIGAGTSISGLIFGLDSNVALSSPASGANNCLFLDKDGTDALEYSVTSDGEISSQDIATAIMDAIGSEGKVYIELGDDDDNLIEFSVTQDGDKLRFEMTDDGYNTAVSASSTDTTGINYFQGNFNFAVNYKSIGAGGTDIDTTGTLSDAEKTEVAFTNAVGAAQHVATSDINEGSAPAGTIYAEALIRFADTGTGTQNETSDVIKDGAGLQIGDDYYIFAGSDEVYNTEYADNVHVVDIRDLSDLGKGTSDSTGDGKSAANDLRTALDRLSVAAAGNEMFDVQVTKAGDAIALTERTTYNGGANLTMTNFGLENQIRTFSSASSNTVVEKEAGHALTLQIGDTADSYNQLNVNIGDIHTSTLGLDKISIADQDSALAAIDVIKAAINKISDIRGTLGATQNRLDHTINNLSVMTENIQDAESTIRDVDVAEEMMAYTKNNILIQSAQAMLAQANQVPQGVLQLLQ